MSSHNVPVVVIVATSPESKPLQSPVPNYQSPGSRDINLSGGSLRHGSRDTALQHHDEWGTEN